MIHEIKDGANAFGGVQTCLKGHIFLERGWKTWAIWKCKHGWIGNIRWMEISEI